jgi:hypothetical protein
MKGGNNDVATNPQETVNKDDAADKKGRRLKLRHQPLKQRSPSLHQPETKLKGGLMMKPQWNKVLSVLDASPTQSQNYMIISLMAMIGYTKSMGKPSDTQPSLSHPATTSSTSLTNQNTPKNLP